MFEVGIVNPGLPNAFVGKPIDLLQGQDPEQEACLDPRPYLGGNTMRYLIVDPIPVNLIGQPDQLVIHVDDLNQMGPTKLARTTLFALSQSSHKPLSRCSKEITKPRKTESQIARNRALTPPVLAIAATSSGYENRQLNGPKVSSGQLQNYTFTLDKGIARSKFLLKCQIIQVG